MTDKQDALENMDKDGFINESYYKNAVRDIFNRYRVELFPDAEKLTNNHLLAIMPHIYETLFKPSENLPNNQRCNIPYNERNISTLFNIYLQLYNDYLCMPSMYTFSRMTGISEDALNRYLTAGRSEIIKNRREMVQGRLYESPVGTIALANNDIDTGLLYNRQNMIERETIRQGVNVSDFVQIAQNQSDNDSPRLSAI